MSETTETPNACAIETGAAVPDRVRQKPASSATRPGLQAKAGEPVYRERPRDKEFAEAWDHANEAGAEVLERQAVRRAKLSLEVHEVPMLGRQLQQALTR